MATRFFTKVKSFLPRKKRLEDHYELHTVLGCGNYSVVQLGVHRKTGMEVALKILEKEKLPDYERDNLSTEVETLRRYTHTHIVTLLEVFEDRKRFVLVLELLKGGELLHRLQAKKCFTEKEAAPIMKSLLDAVHFLHGNGIVHRDLKPENLLFTSEEEESAELKIADFGFARYIGDGVLHTPCGSPAYVAPEIVKEQAYGKPVDMWSVGVILYIVLCGFPPFYHEHVDEIFLLIERGKFSFPDPYWSNVSAPAKDLITRMLTVNPNERLTAEEALQHPWILENTHPSDGSFAESLSFTPQKQRRGKLKKEDSKGKEERRMKEERDGIKRTKEELDLRKSNFEIIWKEDEHSSSSYTTNDSSDDVIE